MKRTSDELSKDDQRANRTSGTSKRNRRGQPSQLLLVGSEDAFKSDVTYRIFGGPQFRVEGRSTTLLEALAYLESAAIDLVVLSSEFREEELSLFAFDAQRRGFAGLILHVAPLSSLVTVASLANNRESSVWRLGPPSWEGESRGKSESRSNQTHQVFKQCVTPGMQTRPELNEPHRPLRFTAKERAVLMRVSEGLTNQEIADHLKCSEGAVKGILQQLFSKLGVRKRAQVVRMVFEGSPRAIPGRVSS